MWIDTIVYFEPERSMHAIKNVSLAEEHLHDHFDDSDGGVAQPIMPASLMIEGMAQTAGLLVGSLNRFKEKVVLAKIQRAEINEDVVPGQCLRYEAELSRHDPAGAATTGRIMRLDHREGEWKQIGSVDLMFSHIDNNMAGREFPEDNFVFGENFKGILRASGLDVFDERVG